MCHAHTPKVSAGREKERETEKRGESFGSVTQTHLKSQTGRKKRGRDREEGRTSSCLSRRHTSSLRQADRREGETEKRGRDREKRKRQRKGESIFLSVTQTHLKSPTGRKRRGRCPQ